MLRTDKKLQELAQSLFDMSLVEGKPEAARVEAVLANVRRRPAAQQRVLLKHYLRLLRRHVRQNTALVEVAGTLEDAALDSLVAGLEKQLGRPLDREVVQNPELLGGVRVTVGDDVYDASVAGRLARLEAVV